MRKKSNYAKTKAKGEFFDKVQLPSDIVLGEAIAMMHENRRLQIQNVKGMVECTSNKIRLITKKNRIDVTGIHLEILEYSKEEIIIIGCIEQILYLEK